MSYRLLDPLARDRSFLTVEGPDGLRRSLVEFNIVPDALKAKEGDSWLKKGAKFAARAPFDGIVATKDLIMGGDAESTFGKTLGWNKKTNWLDRAQDVVDIIGVIDPTGIADAANALGYAARGKWGQAGISALGIIPYAGDVFKLGKYAARGGKVASKGAKVAPELMHAAQVAERKIAAKTAEREVAKTAVQGAEVAAKTGSKLSRAVEKGKGLYRRGKDLYQKAQPYIQRGKEAQEKIQGRRDAEGGTAQPNALTRVRQAADKAAAAVDKVQDVVDQGRKMMGGPEAPQGGAGAPQEAPQGGQEAPKAAEPKTQAPAPQKAPEPQQGGITRTPSGTPLAPVSGKCPAPETKTSVWGAPAGMKRCHPQTPGRSH
jgi:hypothetical protein